MRGLCIVLFVACLLPAGVLPAAAVRTLAGETHRGGALAIADGRVRLGEREFDLADLDWIEPDGPAEPRRSGDGDRILVLVDGGVCPVTEVGSERDDHLSLRTPRAALVLPLEKVRGWGRYPDFLGPPPEGDRVRLANGTIDGDVRGIREGKLLLQTPLDDEPMELPLARVRGLRLRLPAREPEGLHLAATVLAGRPPLLLAPTWPPALALAPGQELPAAGWPRLVVRGGRRVYLSELEPAAVEEEGAFGVVWPHRFGANIDGSPLLLGGNYHDECLVVHSRATLRWSLAGRYARFSAVVGISDLLGEEGDCAVTISGDGTELWHRQSVRGGQDPQPVALDVGEVDELELLVDYGARYDIGDHLVLAEPWLLAKEERRDER